MIPKFRAAESARNVGRHLSQKIRSIRLFLDHSGAAVACDITVAAVEAWLADLTDAGKAAKTVANHRASLGRFVNWLCRRGAAARNDVLSVDAPVVPRTEIVFLSGPEWVTARHLADERLDADPYARAVLLAGLAGLRRSEMAALIGSAFRDLPDGPVVVVGHRTRNKTNTVRAVPLHPDLAAAFAPELAGLNTGAVFPSACTRTWDRKLRPWKAACPTLAKRGQGWHTFRRTFGSRLAAGGTRLEIISELLGHATLEMTRRHYAHLCPNHGRADVGRL